MSHELNLFFRYPRDVYLSAIMNRSVCYGNVPTKRNILALEQRDLYEFCQRTIRLPEPLAPQGKHWQIYSTLTCDTLSKHTDPSRSHPMFKFTLKVRSDSIQNWSSLFISFVM